MLQLHNMADPCTAQWALDEIGRRFDPETTLGLRATVLLVLSGAQGGAFHISLREGKIETRAGRPYASDVQIEASVDDLCLLLRAELKPYIAFLDSRIRVLGDGALALRLRPLLGLA